ncbi:MAG: ATP-binding cassette domain-containing protein [Candidatus Paracaedibacteraceae bacterium]|nr:ATP-binding cassette domain-containing protein [Candidatus Paracaedibacteraceae bacterium]
MEIKSYKAMPWKRWDVMVATAMLNGLALCMALMMIHLYDHMVSSRSYSLWTLITLILATMVGLEMMIRHARSRILSWLKLRYSYQTQATLIDRLVNAAYLSDDKQPRAEQLDLINKNREIQEFLNRQQFLAFLDLPFILIFAGSACFLSPVLMVIPLLGIMLLGLVGIYQGKQLTDILNKRKILDQQHSILLMQTGQNYYTLKTLGMENLIGRRYEKLQYQRAFFDNKINYIEGMTRDLTSIISYAILVGVVCVGTHQVLGGELSIGTLSACIFLTGLMMHPLQSIFAAWFKVKSFQQANKKLISYLNTPPAAARADIQEVELTGELHLENIEFQYPNTEKPILSNLNLSVQPHTLVTIFGASGAGKTTLVQLIMNRLERQQGKITLDGYELKDIEPARFARQVMVVSSSTPLFTGTLMENLILFRVGPLIDEAIKLSQDLGLASWVERQPLGYQTPISEDCAHSIPDGIKQRIGLIRALLNEPKILILDEANAAIDEEGDAQLKETLVMLKEMSTIIFITHRPCMKQIADESYDLVNGTLVPSMNVKSTLRSFKTATTTAKVG